MKGQLHCFSESASHEHWPTDHLPKAALCRPVAGDRETHLMRDDSPNKPASSAILLLHDSISVNKTDLFRLLSLGRKGTTHAEQIENSPERNFKMIALFNSHRTCSQACLLSQFWEVRMKWSVWVTVHCHIILTKNDKPETTAESGKDSAWIVSRWHVTNQLPEVYLVHRHILLLSVAATV